MIYLASPYSHPDFEIKVRRFEEAAKAAAYLMNKGIIIFSPIAMTHPMAIYGELPGHWDFWHRFDREYVKACSELWVLKLSGWEQSRGVRAEIELARSFGKKVSYFRPEALGL